MNNFPSLQELDNNAIFIRGVLGSVHLSCSPWSSAELDAAYANSPYNKDWVGHSNPFPAKYLPVGHGCNICKKIFTENEMVMGIPATIKEIVPLELKKELEDKCRCPNLLNGHSSECALSQNLIFEKK